MTCVSKTTSSATPTTAFLPSRTAPAGATRNFAAGWATCASTAIGRSRPARAPRYSTGTGISVAGARTVEIAGNVIERSYAQGIDVHGAKTSGMWGDVPFTRILIHHNKVWESMLNCNDYGGIETWQGGPAYVFDNLSYNAQGYRNWDHYHRQGPGLRPRVLPGRRLQELPLQQHRLGKIQGRGQPTRELLRLPGDHQLPEHLLPEHGLQLPRGFAPPGAHGRPEQVPRQHLGRDGQVRLPPRRPGPDQGGGKRQGRGAAAGPFCPRNQRLRPERLPRLRRDGHPGAFGPLAADLRGLQGTLQKNKGLLCELGEVSKTSPLRDPAGGDFRPVQGAAGIDKGVKVFVPWSLCGVVGEWNFYPAGNDPTHLIDEHWYMTDYHVSRDEYYQRPMYPLKGVNVTQEDYVQGPLEDWIPGALSFSPARKQYATVSNAEMMKPFSFRDLKKSRHENARPEPCTIAGEALKNPQIYTSNFLIEVYFKTAPGHTGGVLMEKMKGNGYSLTVGAAGKLSFNVKGTSASATAESEAQCERRPVAPRNCRSRPAREDADRVRGREEGWVGRGRGRVPSRWPTRATFTWAARRKDGTWTGLWISCALRRGRSPMPTRRSRSCTPGSSMARRLATSRVANQPALATPAPLHSRRRRSC